MFNGREGAKVLPLFDLNVDQHLRKSFIGDTSFESGSSLPSSDPAPEQQ
jgi:hypothetical protein